MYEKLDKLRAELEKARQRRAEADAKVKQLEQKLKEAENSNEDQAEGSVRAVKSMPASYKKYFGKVADFLLLMTDTCRYVAEGRLYLASLEELKEKNHKL